MYDRDGIPIDSNMTGGKPKANIWQLKRKTKDLRLEDLMPEKYSLIILRKKKKKIALKMSWPEKYYLVTKKVFLD